MKIGDKDGCTNETCIEFSESFPESIYWLKEKVKYPDLVQAVEVLDVKIPILTPTAHGRLLLVAYMALMSENHSNGVSYSGEFSIEDILMIKRKRSPNEIMKILKVPVKAQDIDQGNQATVMDLQKAAKIFIRLYADKKGLLPVYFDQLNDDLENATKLLVANNWFIREYLCYHAAIMPSSARRIFEILLHSTRQNCAEARKSFFSMVKTFCNLSTNWKKTAKSVIEGGTSILRDVFLHGTKKEDDDDPYGFSMREFLRFRRNYFEHGGQHNQKIANMDELELYASWKFGDFHPRLVQALFKSGLLGRKKIHFESNWSCYKLLSGLQN